MRNLRVLVTRLHLLEIDTVLIPFFIIYLFVDEGIDTAFCFADTHLGRLSPDFAVHDNDELVKFLFGMLAHIG